MWKKVIKWFLIVLLVIIVGAGLYYRFFLYAPPAISEVDRAKTTLIPLPAKLSYGKESIHFTDGIYIESKEKLSELTIQATQRFINQFQLELRDDETEKSVVLSIEIEHDLEGNYVSIQDDEAYELSVEKDEISIEAKTPIGVIRALSTLGQLMQKDGNVWLLPEVEIEDYPKYPWRGLMVDVCRHWIPKEVILRIIDEMAMAKLNVFHWHLTEDQGFRIESKVFPRLHEIGSNGKYYTQDEIKEIVNYANARGIRVIPEFDMPGHTMSWQIAYPELSSVSDSLSFDPSSNAVFSAPLNPANKELYTFIDQFITEMSTLFPDEYLHIGGDEVNPVYWNESPEIQQFMKENDLKDAHQLQGYFNQQIQKIVAKNGKKMLGWDEILNSNLSKDVVIQSWRSHKSLIEYVQTGGVGILSSGYYLDYKLPASKHYEVDPLTLKGALNILPDTANWKSYDLIFEVGENPMESQLIIFDKDPENVFGFIAMLDQRTPFQQGKISDKEINFSFTSDFGEIDLKASFLGDSLKGNIGLGFLNFGIHGSRVGGNDLAGTKLPEIETIRELTEEEKANILGGEACMWSEFVDEYNIESRIWPRTAAIAEKLWSPSSLTKDTEDMYRRLSSFSSYLEKAGSTHNSAYTNRLNTFVPDSMVQKLRHLTDFLEEVKYVNRLSGLMEGKAIYLPDLVLNQVADVVRAESPEARSFNHLINKYVESGKDPQYFADIVSQLMIWRNTYQHLVPFFNRSEALHNIEPLAKMLSIVSDELILSLTEKKPVSQETINRLKLLEAGESGAMLAVTPGLNQLIQAMN